MKNVVLESPFQGGNPIYIQYARMAVLDSLSKNEAPIASHLLYPQPGILHDFIPKEREKGIRAGNSWIKAADCLVVYIDFGITEGMLLGIEEAKKNNIPIDFRSLGNVEMKGSIS